MSEFISSAGVQHREQEDTGDSFGEVDAEV